MALPHPNPVTWPGLAVIVAVILGVPMFLERTSQPRAAYDPKPGRALAKAKAEVVFIGDSMLETRLDPEALARLTRTRTFVMAQPGSSSAIWYLMLKNHIATLPQAPAALVIFFRDRQLTQPSYRTEGGYRKTLEHFMRDSEPLVDELLQDNAAAVGAPGANRDWMERAALWAYPMQHHRHAWENTVPSLALDALTTARHYQSVRDAAHRVFALKNLRADGGYNESEEPEEAGKIDDEAYDFGPWIDRSFLPPILELAKSRGIRVIFFKVQRKPMPDGSLRPMGAKLIAYMDELRQYLAAQGATLIDEGQVGQISRDWYTSDDHIAPASREHYTKIFWQRYGGMIAPAAAGAAR